MPLKLLWPSRQKHYDPLTCRELFTAKHPIWLESTQVMFVTCFIPKTQIIWASQLKISHLWNIKEATVVYIQHIVKLALKFSFTEFFLKFTWQLRKHYNYFSQKRNFFTLHKGILQFQACIFQMLSYSTLHTSFTLLQISTYFILLNSKYFSHVFNKLFIAQKNFQISVYIKRSAFSVTTNICVAILLSANYNSWIDTWIFTKSENECFLPKCVTHSNFSHNQTK